jgi:hypothetical protein
LLNIPFLDRAGAWFLESGIQEPSGGVARYYLADAKQNKPVSTEITGYAISALVYLYSLTQDERYLRAATSAARFLTRSAWDFKLRIFPFECSGPSLAYFFDSGIIIRGLLGLWRVTGDRELIDIAEQCGRSMAQDFAADNGGYHPILRLPEKDPLPRGEKWSREQGCYQLKSALAWYDLHKETGQAHFLKLYEDALTASLRTHDSFLPGAEGDLVMDRLHAYCYFLEAILPRAERPEVAAALAGGIAKASHYLRNIAPQFERSDVYAQLLRVRVLTDCAGGAAVDRSAAAHEAGKIESFQLDDPDRRISGGSFFARRGGRLQPHVNPVSTAFGLQALAMWRQYLAGERQLAPGALI